MPRFDCRGDLDELLSLESRAIISFFLEQINALRSNAGLTLIHKPQAMTQIKKKLRKSEQT